MSTLIPMLLMTPIQAANLRDQTLSSEHRLEPILIRGGPYAGRYALNARVKYDPNHASNLDALTLLQEVPVDIETAFPPEEEVVE